MDDDEHDGRRQDIALYPPPVVDLTHKSYILFPFFRSPGFKAFVWNGTYFLIYTKMGSLPCHAMPFHSI